MHDVRSISTRGCPLILTAFIYDFLEILCLVNKQEDFDDVVIHALAPQPADQLLDLGCGTGLLSEKIACLLAVDRGGRVTGIDTVGKVIGAVKRKREGKNCLFRSMAGESLQFADGSFDGVVSKLFFNHLPLDVKRKTLQEISRVLKPGGRLVIADMDTPTTLLGAAISHVSRWLFMQPQIGENIRGVLPQLIQEAGFAPPWIRGHYFGYLTIFSTDKPY